MAENLARAWWKATRSNGSGACVEVAVFTDGSIGVRDSKNPTGKVLRLDRSAWDAFLRVTQRGDFDF